MQKCESESVSFSVVSDSLQPHAQWPARLLCLWDSPAKNAAVDSHSLLQGIFLAQALNLGLPHCREILHHLSHQGSPCRSAKVASKQTQEDRKHLEEQKSLNHATETHLPGRAKAPSKDWI